MRYHVSIGAGYWLDEDGKTTPDPVRITTLRCTVMPEGDEPEDPDVRDVDPTVIEEFRSRAEALGCQLEENMNVRTWHGGLVFSVGVVQPGPPI